MARQTKAILAALQKTVIARRFEKKLSYRKLCERSGILPDRLKSIEETGMEDLDFLSFYQLAIGLGCFTYDLFKAVEVDFGPGRNCPGSAKEKYDQRLQRFEQTRQAISVRLREISMDIRMLRKRRFVSCTQRDHSLSQYRENRLSPS